MAIHAYTWLYMARHAYTWLSVAIHSFIWLYMTIHGKTLLYMVVHGSTWLYMAIDIFTRNMGRSVYNLRISRRNLALPAVKTNYYQNNFAYTGAKIWNALPDEMRYEKSMKAFKRKLESLNLSIDV